MRSVCLHEDIRCKALEGGPGVAFVLPCMELPSQFGSLRGQLAGAKSI
jgi:hypothetical protein